MNAGSESVDGPKRKDSTPEPYYADKITVLRDLFGTTAVGLSSDQLDVNGRSYPIVDDVIVLLAPEDCPPAVRRRLAGRRDSEAPSPMLAKDVQSSFSDQWTRFGTILPEHEAEFQTYFDLVPLDSMAKARIADLGCGIGRWSYFLAERCREIVLVDFSEAIFVARRNLRGARRSLFFLGDVTALPFRSGFADMVVCLGVLHHLPTDALQEVRRLARFSSTLLVYVYYALDDRPAAWRAIFRAENEVRRVLSTIRSPRVRTATSWWLAIFVYLPFIQVGRLARPLGLSSRVPLYEFYAGKSVGRIRQDAYDRFLTPIEQRFRREQVLGLRDTFAQVVVSDQPPFWHFLCKGVARREDAEGCAGSSS